MRLKYKTEKKKNWSFLITVVYGILFLSIPLCSFNDSLTFVTWGITILLIFLIFLYAIIKKTFKFDFIFLSLLLFSISSIFSSALNGFRGFKITAPALSILSAIIYFFCLNNKKSISTLFFSSFIADIIFLLAFIYLCRDDIFSFSNIGRLGMNIGDVNDVSIFLSFGFSFSLWKLFNVNHLSVKILLVFVAFGFAYCGFLTGSKIFLILLLVEFVFLLLVGLLSKKIITSLVLLVSVALLCIMIFFLPQFAIIKKRFLDFIATMFNSDFVENYDSNEMSTINRFDMFSAGMEMFMRKPIFGWGIWGFATNAGLNQGWSHNNISESLCNFGLVGSALFHYGFIESFLNISNRKNYMKECSVFIVFFSTCMISVALNSQKIYSLIIPLVFAQFKGDEVQFSFGHLSSKSECKKAVLFISLYSKPEISSSPYYIEDIKKELIKCNFSITTVCPNPVRSLNRELINYYIKNPVSNNELGTCERLFVSKKNLNSVFYRIYRMFIFQIKLKRYLKKNIHRFSHVYIPSNPPIFIPIMIERIARKFGVKTIYAINDIWPDITNKYSFLKRKAKRSYMLADKLVTLSEDMKNTLVSKGVNEEKISVIRIWPQYERKKISFKEDYKTIFYIGNIGEFQNFQLILKVAEIMRFSKATFNIVGSGRNYERVKKQIEKENLCNVKLFGRVDGETAFNFYCRAGLNLISLNSGVINFACPSKTSTCIESRRPCLLLMDDSIYSRELVSKCGFYFNDSFDAKKIADQINEILCKNSLSNYSFNEYSKAKNLNKWIVLFEGE